MLDQGWSVEAMIPGDPVSIDGAADVATTMAERLIDVAHGLEYIETEWTGQAADAFRAYFELQPARFVDAGARFELVAEAIHAHAEALRAARHEAQIAKNLYSAAKAAAPAQLGTAAPPYRSDYVAPNQATPEMQYAIEKLDSAIAAVTSEGAQHAATVRVAIGEWPEREIGTVTQAPHSGRLEGFLSGGVRAFIDTVGMTSPNYFLPGGGAEQVDAVEERLDIDNDAGSYLAGGLILGSLGPGGPGRAGATGARGTLARLLARLGIGELRSLSDDAARTLLSAPPGIARPENARFSLPYGAPDWSAERGEWYWSRESAERWVERLYDDAANSRATVGRPGEPAYEYQVERTGRDTEVRIRTMDESAEIFADGVRVEEDGVAAIEAKWVMNPGSSSVNEGTAIDFIQEPADQAFRSEMERYAAVIRDPTNPVERLSLEVRTPQAAEYLGAIARDVVGDNIDLRIVVTGP